MNITALVTYRSRNRDSLTWREGLETDEEVHLRIAEEAASNWAMVSREIRGRYETKYPDRAVVQIHVYRGVLSFRQRDASELSDVARERREALAYVEIFAGAEASRATARIHTKKERIT